MATCNQFRIENAVSLRAKIVAKDAEVTRLRDALQSVEYVSVIGGDGLRVDYCPLCRSDKKFEHYDDCLIGNALAGAEAQP